MKRRYIGIIAIALLLSAIGGCELFRPEGISVKGGELVTGNQLVFSVHGDVDSKRTVSRWDFNGDGIWDTDFDNSDKVLYQYSQAGSFTVKVKVYDVDGEEWVYELPLDINLGSRPLIESEYYIIALLDSNTWLNYQSDDPELASGQNAEANYFIIKDDSAGFMQFNAAAGGFSLPDIQSLVGQSIAVSGAHPNLAFGYRANNGVMWHSMGLLQTQNTATIVSAEWNNMNGILKLTGTFECQISTQPPSVKRHITQGEFSMMLSL